MTESEEPTVGDPADGSPTDHAGAADPSDPVFDEVRAAAGEVITSLKRLIDATERVVENPGAFAGAVESGRSVVEAFLGGFAAQATDSDAVDDDPAARPTAERDQEHRES